MCDVMLAEDVFAVKSDKVDRYDSVRITLTSQLNLSDRTLDSSCHHMRVSINNANETLVVWNVYGVPVVVSAMFVLSSATS